MMKAASKPKLSIVIASDNARPGASKCLREVESQCAGNEIEIIVVDNSTDEMRKVIAREFSLIKLFESSKDKLIPELWGIGINQSSGDYVALTTTHFVPAKDWVREILAIHASPCSGVGGAIENDQQAGLVSWAVYFCRYSAYMLPFTQKETDDFAADNASYKRADLERVKAAAGEGFWETFVHGEMRKEKMRLVLAPTVVVYHRGSFSFSEFMRQRFRHGRQFGRARASGISNAARAAYALLSPLIPLIYVYRISRRVFARKRNVDRYFLSLPILALFLLSWSLGEFSGYLRKPK